MIYFLINAIKVLYNNDKVHIFLVFVVPKNKILLYQNQWFPHVLWNRPFERSAFTMDFGHVTNVDMIARSFMYIFCYSYASTMGFTDQTHSHSAKSSVSSRIGSSDYIMEIGFAMI